MSRGPVGFRTRTDGFPYRKSKAYIPHKNPPPVRPSFGPINFIITDKSTQFENTNGSRQPASRSSQEQKDYSDIDLPQPQQDHHQRPPYQKPRDTKSYSSGPSDLRRSYEDYDRGFKPGFPSSYPKKHRTDWAPRFNSKQDRVYIPSTDSRQPSSPNGNHRSHFDREDNNNRHNNYDRNRDRDYRRYSPRKEDRYKSRSKSPDNRRREESVKPLSPAPPPVEQEIASVSIDSLIEDAESDEVYNDIMSRVEESLNSSTSSIEDEAVEQKEPEKPLPHLTLSLLVDEAARTMELAGSYCLEQEKKTFASCWIDAKDFGEVSSGRWLFRILKQNGIEESFSGMVDLVLLSSDVLVERKVDFFINLIAYMRRRQTSAQLRIFLKLEDRIIKKDGTLEEITLPQSLLEEYLEQKEGSNEYTEVLALNEWERRFYN